MKENSPHPFSADRPISSVDEDRLDRGKFVKEFSKSIGAWKGKDSIVIAIYGDWGAGKTSLKNLIIEEMQEQKLTPLVMDFNPWQRAGKFDLLEIFFNELAQLLGKVDKGKKYEELAKKVKRYGRYFTAGKSFFTAFKQIVLGVIFTFAIVNLFTIWTSGNAISIAKLLTALISFIVLGVLAYFEGLFKNIYSFFDELSEIHKKGLNDTKKELADALKKIEHPILVVLDDVDRLSPEEVKTVLQLVKANADFPNLIYLLLFQRDVLETAIRIFSQQDGREYLEKIVQIGINIPEIDRVKLEGVLFERLNELLVSPEIDSKFQQERWRELYIPGLRPYFGNMRDVNRFVSTLTFHIECFKGDKVFEVNPVDLIAIEVLRVFEPAVYKAVCCSKQYLTEKYDDKEKENHRKIFNDIVVVGSSDKKKAIEKILSVLFFNVCRVYEGDMFGDSAETDFKYSRISHSEIFDRYFYFKTPAGDIANSEIEVILSSTNDRDRFYQFLSAHKEKGQLKTLLDRIGNYIEEISIDSAVPFITALFDISDNLPEEEAFTIGEKSYVSRIFRNLILRENDPQRRYDIFLTCISSTSGLFMPVYLVHGEDLRHESKKTPDRYVVADEKVDSLKQKCVEKIAASAATGEIFGNDNCFFILYLWHKWGESEKVTEFALNVSEDNRIFAFITFTACTIVVSTSGKNVTRRHNLDLKYFEKIYGLEYLTEKLKSIDIDDIDENEKIGIEALGRALNRRAAGKSEDDFDDD
jgi:predicted KAP-like P-loop ATPase